jgi:hypothetical protein
VHEIPDACLLIAVSRLWKKRDLDGVVVHDGARLMECLEDSCATDKAEM